MCLAGRQCADAEIDLPGMAGWRIEQLTERNRLRPCLEISRALECNTACDFRVG